MNQIMPNPAEYMGDLTEDEKDSLLLRGRYERTPGMPRRDRKNWLCWQAVKVKLKIKCLQMALKEAGDKLAEIYPVTQFPTDGSGGSRSITSAYHLVYRELRENMATWNWITRQLRKYA